MHGFMKFVSYENASKAMDVKEKLSLIHKKVIEYDEAFNEQQNHDYDQMLIDVERDVRNVLGEIDYFNLSLYPNNTYKIMMVPLDFSLFP